MLPPSWCVGCPSRGLPRSTSHRASNLPHTTLIGRNADGKCGIRGLTYISESKCKALVADMADDAARASSLAAMRASDLHGMQGQVYIHAPNQPLATALPNFTSTHPLAPAPPVCQPTPQSPLDKRNLGGKGVGKTCSACREAGYSGLPSTHRIVGTCSH